METNKKAFEIADLIARQKQEQLTEQEQERLRQWIEASEKNRALYHSLLEEQEATQQGLSFLSEVDVSTAWQKVARATGQLKEPEPEVIPLWQHITTWRNVAAVLVLVAMATVLFKFTSGNTVVPDQNALAVNTVFGQPGEVERAQLILQDGSRIDLDSLHTGTLQELNGVKVISEDGILRIDASALTEPSNSLVAYNTITTPRGIQYQVILPDGSKVWLNAASSLKFPTAFTGKNRTVELSGEAYFDVVKDSRQFIVNTGLVDVTVLGTSFNVSAYADDAEISTTLVTGRVQVAGANENVVETLTPGKRAVFTKSDQSMLVSQVETEIYTVWKEGKIYFEDEDLQTIIRKLDRWYETGAVHLDANAKTKTFTGVAYKNKSLENLLEMISQTTDLTIEKKGEKLFVKKK